MPFNFPFHASHYDRPLPVPRDIGKERRSGITHFFKKGIGKVSSNKHALLGPSKRQHTCTNAIENGSACPRNPLSLY